MNALTTWIDKLNVLSTTEIRDFLVRENALGATDDAESCPLANFLRAQGVERPNVVPCNTVDFTTCADSDVRSFAEHSESLSTFIRAFDQGEFPELVARDAS